MINDNTKPALRRVIPGLLFGFLVFVVLLLVGDLRQVSSQLHAFDWTLYPYVLGFTLLNYFLRFLKWHYYLNLFGLRDYPLLKSARLFLAGFPLSVTPGKVGEALKGIWVNQETGLPTAKGIAVVLAERITDGLGVLLLSILGVIAYPRYWPAFAFTLAGLILLIVLIQIRPAALYLLDLGAKIPLIKKFIHGLCDFYEGSYTLFRPQATLTAVSLGIISWLGEGVGMYLVLLGLGIPPSWNHLSIAVFVLSFSTAIGAISTLPGGLGAAEASIAGMLTLLLGIHRDTAAAATLLIRFATLWFAVGIGLVVWIFSKDLLFPDTGNKN